MSGLPSLLVALGVVGVVFSLLSLLIVLFSGSGLQMDFGWTLGNLVVGVALLVSAAAMNVDALRESMVSGGARRARKYGTSTVLTTVLGIALLGMLGFLGTRYHRHFDWTEQKIHTLSDQSRRVLAGLEADVKVQALVSRTEQAPMRDLLDRYAYESKRFRVEYADPIERPGLVESLGIAREQLDRDGLVRIEIAGEHVVVEDLSEQNVTNALVKLTRTGEKVVYFAQGHGEKAIEGEAADGRDGFKFAAEALRNENYRVEPLLLAQFSEVPEDADVVIVAGAERRFPGTGARGARPLPGARRRTVRAGGASGLHRDHRAARVLGRRASRRHRDRPRAGAVRPRDHPAGRPLRCRAPDHQGPARPAQRPGDVPRGAQRPTARGRRDDRGGRHGRGVLGGDAISRGWTRQGDASVDLRRTAGAGLGDGGRPA